MKFVMRELFVLFFGIFCVDWGIFFGLGLVILWVMFDEDVLLKLYEEFMLLLDKVYVFVFLNLLDGIVFGFLEEMYM